MKSEDLKHIIVTIIAVVALILALFSVLMEEAGEINEEENIPPSANISVISTSVEVGSYISFDGSGSTDSHGAIVEYIWDFGDGIKDSGLYESHFYYTAGTYNVTLTVIDNEGESDVDSIEITVNPHQNDSPNAAINVNTMTVEVGQYVYFNASESTDLDGTIIEYTWDFGDGTKDSGMYSIYFYSSAGTYSVILTVIDDEGANDIDSVSITVIEGEGPPQNEPPVAVIYVENTTVEDGSNIIFNGSESSDSDGTIVEYTWDFGDGTKDSGMHSSHIYQTYGTYNVTLTVIDDDGAIDVMNITITVLQKTPTINMNWNEDPGQPGNYTGNVIALSGISELFTDDVIVIVTQDSQSGSKDLDVLAGSSLTVGTLTLSFNDQTPNGELGAADIFTIVYGQTGDTIKLVFKPTGGQMSLTTL
ncbi:MAG: PKD domain-containing protein [Thermoplasmata archaeon]